MTQVTLTPAQIAAGLIDDGFGLGANQFTFSVPTAASVWPDYGPGEENSTGYSVFNITQANAFRLAILTWDELILPNFREVADDASTRGEVRAAFTTTEEDTAGYAYAGSPRQPGSFLADVWLSNDYVGQSFAQGTFQFELLVHEIGHTLGLKHPFEDPALPAAFDSTRFTIMAYNVPLAGIVTSFVTSGSGIRSNSAYVDIATPMVVDIAAVQTLYGADPTTRSGASVYRFNQDDTALRSIYDAGGADTIDLSNFTRSNTIDLTPGAYSSIGEFPLEAQIAYWTAQFPNFANFIRSTLSGQDLFVHGDNLGIALSSIIENATGGSAADKISGNAVANTLRGMGGNDILSGGDGDDVLDGGSGDDVLTGGAGADLFVLAASGAGADRVTDFAVASDRFDLGGGRFTALAESGGNTVLTHAGGTVQLDGVTGLTLAQVMTTTPAPTPTPSPTPTPTPSPAPAGADQFTLIAGTAVQGTVTGTGRVAAGGPGVQDITVLDAPGRISFGATFNDGGDRVRLSGAAAGWTVVRSGSSAQLSDGDTVVVLPVGTVGVDLIFADGVRTLKINAAGTELLIGGQAITTTAAAIGAGPGPATATAAIDPSLAAQLVLTGAGPVTAIGNERVAGSPVRAETVVVAAGGTIAFGATFNAGGDTIVLPGALGGYSASRSGSTVSLLSAGETISVAIGTVGTTIRFDGGAQGLLRFDEAAGQVKLGTAVIGATPTQLTAIADHSGGDIAAAPYHVPIDVAPLHGLIA